MPVNLKLIQMFLGLLGSWWMFVPHTIQVFYHLYNLIRGRCGIDWYGKKRLSHLRKILVGQAKQSRLEVPQGCGRIKLCRGNTHVSSNVSCICSVSNATAMKSPLGPVVLLLLLFCFVFMFFEALSLPYRPDQYSSQIKCWMGRHLLV